MDLVIDLPISANRKSNSYDLILVIVDRITKMVYNELVRVTIDPPSLAKVIIDVVVRHIKVSESIVTD